INGLGVVGWGVGGIEAEAVMLGQPYYMLMPQVVGFELTGKLPAGATATDLVLTVTEILRGEGVVGKFVEFYGSGVGTMSLADRATIANMSPEYGATMGFFPVDEESLDYMRRTGRTEQEVDLVEQYTKQQNLFRGEDSPVPQYTSTSQLDLGGVEPSLAGPKRPQDRISLSAMKSSFQSSLTAPVSNRGFALDDAELQRTATIQNNGESSEIGHGAVVIAAITSCTNTSNPSVMIAAGLVAKKAVEAGLSVPAHVKTSLAPGSRVVTDYLNESGLDTYLEKIGFYTVGYGCTTCIGNSGPLPPPVAKAVNDGDLVAAAVLSGNRNFEGRVNPLVKANYLASPPLVVAYALAGTTDIDLTSEPIGKSSSGTDVYLKDIWPDHDDVQSAMEACVKPEMFRKQYRNVFQANETWNKIDTGTGSLFDWSEESTYIQEPPFLVDLPVNPGSIQPLHGGRVLAALGDSVTTDHISPAGAIATDGPAGQYLQQQGVEPQDFNSFGSRRGNDRVMTRGTFGNIRIRNQLAPGTEGGFTQLLPDGVVTTIYEAAMQYKERHVPLVVLAGAEYGTGSSRDWAAKGTLLLGVRVVIATSYERIHRSNLVGMGVLPLEFVDGDNWQSLGLTGTETYDIEGLDDSLQVGSLLTVVASDEAGGKKSFDARVRIDTPVELDYYRNGGILQKVLRKLRSDS
ncbi:MAG: aconitate hydratase AcnA, partial [Planctomycetales bacterium]